MKKQDSIGSAKKPIRIMPEHQAVGAITAGMAVPPFQRLTLISPFAMLRVSEFKQRKSIQLLHMLEYYFKPSFSSYLHSGCHYSSVFYNYYNSRNLVLCSCTGCGRSIRSVEFTQKLKMDEDCHSYNQL